VCGRRSEFETSVRRIAQDRPIKTREPLCRDLLLKLAGGLDLRVRTEFAGDEICRLRAQTMRDVVAGNHEVVSLVITAANHDVTMGMPRVEVISRDPVELRAEILFHLPHEVADKGLQVRKFCAVFGRHDEPELVAIAGAPFCEWLAVGAIAAGVVQLARLAITRDAVTLNVCKCTRTAPVSPALTRTMRALVTTRRLPAMRTRAASVAPWA
jgi:hypothetical protein